jgi:hypothetical protein
MTINVQCPRKMHNVRSNEFVSNIPPILRTKKNGFPTFDAEFENFFAKPNEWVVRVFVRVDLQTESCAGDNVHRVRTAVTDENTFYQHGK